MYETIHDTCQSNKTTQILNRIGLCKSYDELKKTDVCLADRTVATAGSHNTPISSIIRENTKIHGAMDMDNSDHEENTQSGKGGSHNAILMLF